ncbi:hypothetical protein FACS189499_10490 [Clostridia bacterium]|nr:hypothetical protein FACS189499_10490 [Clostridia bacterium]
MNIARNIRRLRLPKLRLPSVKLALGKKQFVIAGLTLVLGAAVYVNYLYASGDSLLSGNSTPALIDTGANYGDARLVANDRTGVKSDNSFDTSAYFAQARIDKQASRDEAKEFMATVLGGGDVTGEEIAVIATDAGKISNYIESEAKIETLLKAQGFNDILCYISEKGANIIVHTADPSGLTGAEAAKIKDTLLSEVTVPADKITIVEIH